MVAQRAYDVIVAKLQTRWAGAVSRLGLTQRLAFLADYTVQYRQAIDEQRNLTFATVARYRAQGQQNLREIVIVVLATYLDASDDDQVAARDQLLEPLLVQLHDLRAKARARRSNDPSDDEPTADDPVDTPDEDTPEAGEPAGEAAASPRR